MIGVALISGLLVVLTGLVTGVCYLGDVACTIVLPSVWGVIVAALSGLLGLLP